MPTRRAAGAARAACALALALLLLAAGPRGHASIATAAESAGDAPAVQELVLGDSWRLQERGEVQVTVAGDRDPRPAAWTSEIESEWGLARWLQLGLGTSLSAAEGEARSYRLGALISPWPASQRWHLAAGAARETVSGQARGQAANEWIIIGGFEAHALELHAATRWTRAAGETTPTLAAALAHRWGAWTGLLEASREFRDANTMLWSPGVAWHPSAAIEITAGAPMHFDQNVVTAGAAIRVTGEWEIVR